MVKNGSVERVNISAWTERNMSEGACARIASRGSERHCRRKFLCPSDPLLLLLTPPPHHVHGSQLPTYRRRQSLSRSPRGVLEEENRSLEALSAGGAEDDDPRGGEEDGEEVKSPCAGAVWEYSGVVMP